MGALAQVINQYLSNSGSKLRRAVELANLGELQIGLDRKVYAVIRYVDPMLFRGVTENLSTDLSTRENFAREGVVAFYDSETYKGDVDGLLAYHDKLAQQKGKPGFGGELCELTLKVICPRLFGVDLSHVSSQVSANGVADRVHSLDDVDDVATVVKAMDGLIFTLLYYNAVSLADFVRKEVERTKNSLGSSSNSPSPSIPLDLATATA